MGARAFYSQGPGFEPGDVWSLPENWNFLQNCSVLSSYSGIQDSPIWKKVSNFPVKKNVFWDVFLHSQNLVTKLTVKLLEETQSIKIRLELKIRFIIALDWNWKLDLLLHMFLPLLDVPDVNKKYVHLSVCFGIINFSSPDSWSTLLQLTLKD